MYWSIGYCTWTEQRNHPQIKFRPFWSTLLALCYFLTLPGVNWWSWHCKPWHQLSAFCAFNQPLTYCFHTTELVRVHYNGWSRSWSANRPVDPERQKSLKRSDGGKLHIHCKSHMRWRCFPCSVNMVHSNVLQLRFFKTWYHRDWWETVWNIRFIDYDTSYPRVLAKLETGGDVEVPSTCLMDTELQFVHGACRNFRYLKGRVEIQPGRCSIVSFKGNNGAATRIVTENLWCIWIDTELLTTTQ